MNKYLVACYNNTNLGPVNHINVRVVANSESEAVSRACQTAGRSDGAIIEIEVIDGPGRDIMKG